MSDKKESTDKKTSADPELDELLDSALEDFSKKDDAENKSESTEDKEEDDLSGEWTADYITQAGSNFQSSMSALIASIPGDASTAVTQEQLQQSLKKMAEAASQVVADPHSVLPTQESKDFATCISQTLQSLSLGAENLQNPFAEQDILNMFGNDSAEGNVFLPFMQGMMQSLLSKEVLYPSLKDILDRYPAWLEEKKEQIDASDYEKYNKQMELMKEVCDELDKDQDGDDDNIKKERFEKVLVLMQKMQDFGPPPADLVGEIQNLPFDAEGNLLLDHLNPTDPNQCTMM